MGGKPRIAGRRITVENIAVSYEDDRKTPEQIAAAYDLTLGQVYAALDYYKNHKDEIRVRQQEGLELAERLRAGQPFLEENAAAKIRAKLASVDPSGYIATLSSATILVYLQSDLCPAEHRELIRTDLPRRLAANPTDPDTLELQARLGSSALERQS